MGEIAQNLMLLVLGGIIGGWIVHKHWLVKSSALRTSHSLAIQELIALKAINART